MAEHIIGVIGAGGKTTALGLLARQTDRGSVLLTTTTHIFPFPPAVCRTCLQDPEEGVLKAALGSGGIVCAGAAAAEGKLKMLPPSVLAAGLETAATVIYEGDGSKHLPLKLHREDEPVLLPETTVVLIVAGLSALGRPVSAAVHRYELDGVWRREPDLEVGKDVFLRCVLETAQRTKLPYEQLRVFLNQEDACEDAKAASDICRKLRQYGLTVRSGSLRENPPALFDWVISKER